MSNLYLTIERLEALAKSTSISKEQCAFISKLLNLNETYNLRSVARFLDPKQIERLIQTIKDELHKTPYLTFQSRHLNFTYIRALKAAIHDIKATQKRRKKIKNVDKKTWAKYLKIYDHLYSDTEQTYQGTIMLPVNQNFDPRLADDLGECAGYSFEWAFQILNHKNPFGVNLKEPSPLRPLDIRADASRQYPELHQCAVINHNVAIYQNLRVDKGALLSKMNEPLENNMHVVSETEKEYTRFNSADEIGEELINCADSNVAKVFRLNVFSKWGQGHALAFCKHDNQYHFFDSNAGWFRFEDADHFKKWLTYYFEKTDYSKDFERFGIESYTLTNAAKPTETLKKPSVFLKTVLITLFAPLIIIGSIIQVCRLIVKGIYNVVKGLVSRDDTSKTQDVSVKQPPLPSIKELPTSLAPLDLAVRQHNDEKAAQRSSFAKISGMLDIPLSKLAKAHDDASNNETFKNAQKRTAVVQGAYFDKAGKLENKPEVQNTVRLSY